MQKSIVLPYKTNNCKKNLSNSIKNQSIFNDTFNKTYAWYLYVYFGVWCYWNGSFSNYCFYVEIQLTFVHWLYILLEVSYSKMSRYLHQKTTKMFPRKTKEIINKWRDILCVHVIRLHIGKISIFPKLIYRFRATPIKMPAEISLWPNG